jgi:Sec-independent protein secretion pathway component TatC
MGDRRAFLADLAILWAAAFVLVALLTPPDPFTQLFVAGPLLLAAVPVAWWLAYRDGHERLRAVLG